MDPLALALLKCTRLFKTGLRQHSRGLRLYDHQSVMKAVSMSHRNSGTGDRNQERQMSDTPWNSTGVVTEN